jgi:hypothetical protein
VDEVVTADHDRFRVGPGNARGRLGGGTDFHDFPPAASAILFFA